MTVSAQHNFSHLGPVSATVSAQHKFSHLGPVSATVSAQHKFGHLGPFTIVNILVQSVLIFILLLPLPNK